VVLPHAATTSGITISATTMRMMERVFIVFLLLWVRPPRQLLRLPATRRGRSLDPQMPCFTKK
jgi:hypothetical protein